MRDVRDEGYLRTNYTKYMTHWGYDSQREHRQGHRQVVPMMGSDGSNNCSRTTQELKLVSRVYELT
jgi:hemerythrin